MDDISEQLARRDRFRRQRMLEMTGEQRIAEMQKLQARAFASIASRRRASSSGVQ